MMKIKKGDTVKVIAGSSKGKEAKVLSVDIDKKKVVVEGVNVITKHSKPSAGNPNGGIITKEAPIDISNVMLVEGGKATRVGFKVTKDENGKVVKKERFAKKTGNVIK
ncbi:MAG: 50S ribosomal protein L24 [Lachnospiraceae bacterium]|jgi:large subunit ribosomal protein L24|nr:50S ribosomal protein L24 [Lachnospiraceae bacterium]MBR4412348.1 50S ribosomal protein L24 [Lachnospiraceae bacterium]MBR6383218.1 50S ribosomal protein L24 [Lachnospiraceae bacterium]